jgi:hypothetical protein
MLIKSILIKSIVTVTTSYRNKNWESKLRRQGNEGIANFGTRAVVRYKANKGPKGGRTRLPANEATFRYQSSFVNYFGGTPYT